MCDVMRCAQCLMFDVWCMMFNIPRQAELFSSFFDIFAIDSNMFLTFLGMFFCKAAR